MSVRHREVIDNVLAGIEGAVRAIRKRDPSWLLWLRRCRWMLTWASIAYVATLVLGLFFMQWVGERYWVFSVLLLLPPVGWLLPLVLLTPLCLVLRARICLLHLLAITFVLFVFMPFQWSLGRAELVEGEVLTVLTNNAGQRRTRTLFGLVEEVRPDIIALQDASASQGRALARAQGDPDMHVVQHAHLVLVSRFPILRSGLVEGLSFRNIPAAAWYELDCRGRTLMVYNIHLPTPRHDLENLRGNGFLVEIPGRGGVYSSAVRDAYKEALGDRLGVAEALAEMLAAESRPLLALGDFNATTSGYVRRLFSAEFTDAFAAAGRGYGFTFPSVSRNPLSFFGPWLRIDYIFVDENFRTLECEVESRQPAQHRAVVARLERR